MKIYILNASNMYNYGSMMMAENFISYFERESNSKNTYFVETDDENTLGRLKTATELENIRIVPPGSLYRNGYVTKQELLLSTSLKLKIFSDLADEIDMVVILGGDDYTEDYGWRSLISQLLRANAIAGKLKVLFIGQTMGPYYSFRRAAAKFLLSRVASILVRDSITFNYLSEMGLKNIDEIPDLALLPLTRESKNEDYQKEYICVFPSELIYHYSKSPERTACLNFYTKVCEHINKKFPQYKIVLVPHV